MCEAEIITRVTGDADWFGILREGRIFPAARLADVFVNELDSHSRMLRMEGMRVERDACLHAGTLSLGGERTKSDLRFLLRDPGCEVRVHGSVYGDAARHDDHHIELKHRKGNNLSRLVWNAACDGRSRAIGTGLLTIDKNAHGSDAGQLFKNMLLSPDATADSIPELEVSANDVLAAHGTANGPLDDAQVFYLLSRGFTDAQARAILVESFLNDTLKDIGSEVLTDWLFERLRKHLNS
jgi:Fe-S cluster assembly protein SufD